MNKISVLFVCLGNICRSPAAEAIFISLLEKKGLTDGFIVDSAGNGSWHIGKKADFRMRIAAERRDINILSWLGKLLVKILTNLTIFLRWTIQILEIFKILKIEQLQLVLHQ